MADPAPSSVPKRPGTTPNKSKLEPRGDRSSASGTIAGFRKPVLRVELRDVRHKATRVFLDHFDMTTDMDDLVHKVVTLLYRPRAVAASLGHESRERQGSWQTIGSETSDVASSDEKKDNDRTIPHDPNIPQTRSVTLVVREMDGVAYTTGMDLDDAHKEIHFAFEHIVNTMDDAEGRKAEVRNELLGVICHELVHCYQQYGDDVGVPGGLTEGIADWVRLHAGYIPSHWKKEAGSKVEWDAGYQTTGYFLDWLDDTYGEGHVRKINQRLMSLTKYDEKSFWNDLFGKSVGELWKNYSATLGKTGQNGQKA